MAEVILRHPVCDCEVEDKNVTSDVAALANALRLSALINGHEIMGLCSRNIVMALLLTVSSIMSSSSHHVSDEQDDREVEEGLARIREMRPLMRAIAESPPKQEQH